jgi:hypothetical protein
MGLRSRHCCSGALLAGSVKDGRQPSREFAPPSGRLKDDRWRARRWRGLAVLDPAGRRSFGLGMGLRAGVATT